MLTDGADIRRCGAVGDRRAACALYDSEQDRVTFYRVPYEVEKAQKAIINAKLPERLATRLNEGR